MKNSRIFRRKAVTLTQHPQYYGIEYRGRMQPRTALIRRRCAGPKR
jgi:hypothetical protein